MDIRVTVPLSWAFVIDFLSILIGNSQANSPYFFSPLSVLQAYWH